MAADFRRDGVRFSLVWDVLREPNANGEVVLIIAPKGREYAVAPYEDVLYT